MRGDALTNPDTTKEYVHCKLGSYEREVFTLLLLDNQNQLIEFKELFQGTVDAASVYLRQVVKTVLEVNTAAVIFAHNHPSGDSTPSQAYRRITERLKDALALVVTPYRDRRYLYLVCRKGVVMIDQHYGVLSIDDSLHTSLEALLNRYTLPENAERPVLNCRQMSYYRHRQGLHPIAVQFKCESASSSWLVVFFASLSR